MFRFHRESDLVLLDFEYFSPTISYVSKTDISPGEQVRHTKDRDSYGVVVSVDSSTPRTICVLWSRLSENKIVDNYSSYQHRPTLWKKNGYPVVDEPSITALYEAYRRGEIKDAHIEQDSNGNVTIDVEEYDPAQDQDRYVYDGSSFLGPANRYGLRRR